MNCLEQEPHMQVAGRNLPSRVSPGGAWRSAAFLGREPVQPLGGTTGLLGAGTSWAFGDTKALGEKVV